MGEDSDNEDLNDPSEAQLEAMLMAEESDSDDSDLDGAPSAFAAAEEYAKLLEDDVDQSIVDEFRAKRKKGKKKEEKPKANLGKRKFKGKQNPKSPKNRRKKKCSFILKKKKKKKKK